MKIKKIAAILTGFVITAASAAGSTCFSYASSEENILCKDTEKISVSIDDRIKSEAATSGNTDAVLAVIKKCGLFYGYKDMVLRKNPTGRQKLYNDMFTAAMDIWNRTTDIKAVPAPFDDDVMYTTKQFDLNEYGLDHNEAAEVYYTFRNDNPIFYFLSNYFYYTSRSYSQGTQTEEMIYFIVYPEFAKASVRKDYNSQLLDFIAGFSDCVKGRSLYEDARAIYKKLALSIDYAYDTDGIPVSSADAHTVIGAAVTKKGVCEAYARTYEMLCNYYGIDNIFVSGVGETRMGEYGDHAWNVIRMDDGRYYYADCTWDDGGDTVSDSYFAKGSDLFNIDHIPDTPDGTAENFLYALPEIESEDYDPYALHGNGDPAKAFEYGDVDGDGIIDSYDASKALNEYALSSIGMPGGLNAGQKKAADVNTDTVIDSSDASLILNYYSYISVGGTAGLRNYIDTLM